MPRVTEAEVRSLLEPYADAVDMTLSIGQATMLVDEELVGKGLSEDRLKYIELNLAAHFATLIVERGGFTYQKSLSAEEGYNRPKDYSKLSSTRFGQAALSLDTSGALSALDSPAGRAEFRVL